MDKILKIVREMRKSSKNVRFSDLEKVCQHVYKTPWSGDPRVNIQQSKGGVAKSYQVKQVLKAIEKIEEDQNG